jgi:hypothetical protein
LYREPPHFNPKIYGNNKKNIRITVVDLCVKKAIPKNINAKNHFNIPPGGVKKINALKINPIAKPARILMTKYSNINTANTKNINNEYAGEAENDPIFRKKIIRESSNQSVKDEKINIKLRRLEYDKPISEKKRFTDTKKISHSPSKCEFW